MALSQSTAHTLITGGDPWPPHGPQPRVGRGPQPWAEIPGAGCTESKGADPDRGIARKEEPPGQKRGAAGSRQTHTSASRGHKRVSRHFPALHQPLLGKDEMSSGFHL